MCIYIYIRLLISYRNLNPDVGEAVIDHQKLMANFSLHKNGKFGHR